MPGMMAGSALRKRTERKASTTTLWLWLAFAVALGLLWFAYDTPIDRSPLRSASPIDRAAEWKGSDADVPRKPTTVADYPEMTARPLFDATRRPPKSAPATPAVTPNADTNAAATAPPLQAQLFGLTRAPGRGPRALVRSTGEATGAWLGIGAELQGWKLAEIASDRVVFRHGDHRRELLMSDGVAEKAADK